MHDGDICRAEPAAAAAAAAGPGDFGRGVNTSGEATSGRGVISGEPGTDATMTRGANLGVAGNAPCIPRWDSCSFGMV